MLVFRVFLFFSVCQLQDQHIPQERARQHFEGFVALSDCPGSLSILCSNHSTNTLAGAFRKRVKVRYGSRELEFRTAGSELHVLPIGSSEEMRFQ